MVLPQSLPMAHGNQCNSGVLHVRVEVSFDVDTDGGSALVENRVDGLVVDQARHCNALFFAA